MVLLLQATVKRLPGTSFFGKNIRETAASFGIWMTPELYSCLGTREEHC